MIQATERSGNNSHNNNNKYTLKIHKPGGQSRPQNSRMQYGITKKKRVRKLAYKFAKANDKKCPTTWDEGEIGGEKRMHGFLKSDSKRLSIRKPRKQLI